MRDRKAEPRRTNLKVFLSCRIVGMASGDRGLAAPLCDHSRCVGSPPEADVALCPRVSVQDRFGRCDVPLCCRVSKLVPTDFIGFSLMARPSKISHRPSGRGVMQCAERARMSHPVIRRWEARGAPEGRRRPRCRAGQRSLPTGRKTGLAWPLRPYPIQPLPSSVSPWPGRGRSAGRSGRCWPRSPCAMRPRRRRPEPSDGQGFPCLCASCLWPPETP